MRGEERDALVARIARALAWRALSMAERGTFEARANGVVAELEADDLEARALGWLWVQGDGAEHEPELDPLTDHRPDCAVNHPAPDADYVKCNCDFIPPHHWDPEARQWVRDRRDQGDL